MNNYANKLGLGGDYEYCDVFGLDDELLDMVPKPAISVLLLFPLTKENQELQQKEDEEMEKNQESIPKELFFMKQTIGNACGTVAILHSLANNIKSLEVASSSFLQDFINGNVGKSSDEIAKSLESDKRVEEAHTSSALSEQNQSEVVEVTDLHFVCFVEKNGHVFELDGRRKFPMNRGAYSGDLLRDAVKVVRNYMSLNPEQYLYNIVALAKKQE